MKTSKVKKALLAGLSVALVAVMAVAGTVAYLQSSTKDVINTFSTNNVNVDLTETGNGQYNIIPGTSQDKDPKVTVDASLPAYVYVEVTDNTQGLVTYDIADGWTKLDGYDNVYYREFTPTEENGNTATYSVLKDDQVSYSASLTNEDMEKVTGDVQLTFKAYAIQKEGFETAEAGWLQIPTEVSNGEDLNAALKNGGNIVLDGDTIAQEYTEYGEDGEPYTYTFINVNSPSNIDLNGYSLEADWINIDADVTIENGTLVVDNSETLFAETADTTVTLKNVTLTTPEGLDGITLFGYYDGVTYVLDDVTTTKNINVSSATIVINSGTYTVDISGAREINGGTFTGDVVVEKTEINDGEINGTITTGENDFVLTINGGSFNKDSLIDKMDYGAGEVVINGGTFQCTQILEDSIKTSFGDLTITGGTFTEELTINTTYAGVINISDGEFKGLRLTGIAYSPITISGGTFESFSNETTRDNLTITGGTFGTDPSAYVGTGYMAVENDGTWTVVADENG